ncbi:hypothetical protein [Mumia sp. Pv 4-285]|uniref:hypothetical protein n=1 Tax=Mumia qirimensis TaxID=3234852 RepID=UPI00351D3136
MTTARALPLVALMLGVGVAGCAEGPQGDGPDCSTRLEHTGTAYRPVSVLRTPSAVAVLGDAAALDCEGSALESSPPVTVRAAAGFDPGTVVIVTEPPEMASLYVDQSLDVDDWPDRLHLASDYPRCVAAARLEGVWESGPDSSGVAPPDLADKAHLRVTRSSGPEVDGWASVEVLVRIPEQLTATTEAIATGAPVQLNARCEGDAYVATGAPKRSVR